MRRLLLLLLLPACTTGPAYLRPADDVPAAFSAVPGTMPGTMPSTMQVQSTTPWWLTLNDPILNGLVDRARQANPEVARARAAVMEARAALAQAQGGGAPQLNASSAIQYGRAFTAPGYYGHTAGFTTAGFDASWELDLWGRTRRVVEAADANAEAASAEADDAVLTLLGDVARIYVELRGTQAGIAATQASIDNQGRANALASSRMAGGDGSRLEILQGQAQSLQQQAQLPLLEAQVSVRVHALSTLCGAPPATLLPLLRPAAPVPQGTPPATGIPADLLRRRPDIRAAERQLAASTALIGAAMAEKYPSVSLSGTLSLSGSSLGGLMTAPLFALAPTVKLPLLDGGQRDAAIDIRRAQAEQARLAYRTAVLKALQEVEDAIARLDGETRHRDQLKQTVGTAQKLVDVARSLYAAGATDFLQVLEAQRTLNANRDALAQAEAARTIQLVALYKALGGGWDAPARLASR